MFNVNKIILKFKLDKFLTNIINLLKLSIFFDKLFFENKKNLKTRNFFYKYKFI